MKHVSDKDFCAWIQKKWDVFDKYYVKINITLLYIVVLILHSLCHINYIKNNWSFKWVKFVLNNMTKFWKIYQDQNYYSLVSEIAAVYYNSEKKKEKKLDMFDQIAQDLEKYAWLTSQDEFQNYCNKNFYDIRKMMILEWWCQDQ